MVEIATNVVLAGLAVFVAAALFCVSGALVAFGLESWTRNAKRRRLILDAYTEGVRDAQKEMREGADT